MASSTSLRHELPTVADESPQCRKVRRLDRRRVEEEDRRARTRRRGMRQLPHLVDRVPAFPSSSA
jgi:hypothetical protein